MSTIVIAGVPYNSVDYEISAEINFDAAGVKITTLQVLLRRQHTFATAPPAGGPLGAGALDIYAYNDDHKTHSFAALAPERSGGPIRSDTGWETWYQYLWPLDGAGGLNFGAGLRPDALVYYPEAHAGFYNHAAPPDGVTGAPLHWVGLPGEDTNVEPGEANVYVAGALSRTLCSHPYYTAGVLQRLFLCRLRTNSFRMLRTCLVEHHTRIGGVQGVPAGLQFQMGAAADAPMLSFGTAGITGVRLRETTGWFSRQAGWPSFTPEGALIYTNPDGYPSPWDQMEAARLKNTPRIPAADYPIESFDLTIAAGWPAFIP